MSGLEPLFHQEHDAYREAVRMFVANEINPHAEEWEERFGPPPPSSPTP